MVKTLYFKSWETEFIINHRIARLATIDPKGWPHSIPIVYAFDGTFFYTPLDEKPKRVSKHQLQRVQNISLNKHVALLIDEYDENWENLAWVLIRGNAKLLESGDQHQTGKKLLNSKYHQYNDLPLKESAIIIIEPKKSSSWRMKEKMIL